MTDTYHGLSVGAQIGNSTVRGSRCGRQLREALSCFLFISTLLYRYPEARCTTLICLAAGHTGIRQF